MLSKVSINKIKGNSIFNYVCIQGAGNPEPEPGSNDRRPEPDDDKTFTFSKVNTYPESLYPTLYKLRYFFMAAERAGKRVQGKNLLYCLFWRGLSGVDHGSLIPYPEKGGEPEMITTKNRRLEQFYFMHGIDYASFYKDMDDGLTVWEYDDNDENRRILEEFRTAIRRREAQKRCGTRLVRDSGGITIYTANEF